MLSPPVGTLGVPATACSVAFPIASATVMASLRPEELDAVGAGSGVVAAAMVSLAVEELDEAGVGSGVVADLLRDACKRETPRPPRGRMQVAAVHSELPKPTARAANNEMKAKPMAWNHMYWSRIRA